MTLSWSSFSDWCPHNKRKFGWQHTGKNVMWNQRQKVECHGFLATVRRYQQRQISSTEPVQCLWGFFDLESAISMMLGKNFGCFKLLHCGALLGRCNCDLITLPIFLGGLCGVLLSDQQSVAVSVILLSLAEAIVMFLYSCPPDNEE